MKFQTHFGVFSEEAPSGFLEKKKKKNKTKQFISMKPYDNSNNTCIHLHDRNWENLKLPNWEAGEDGGDGRAMLGDERFGSGGLNGELISD